MRPHNLYEIKNRMNVNSISGLPPSKENLEPSKWRSNASEITKSDHVEISSEAKYKQSVDSLQKLVKEYLDRIPSIRKDRVETVNKKIKEGYNLDYKMLFLIAERIQSQLKI